MAEKRESLRQPLWLRTYEGESALQKLEWSGISSKVSGFFAEGSIVRGVVDDETVIRSAGNRKLRRAPVLVSMR